MHQETILQMVTVANGLLHTVIPIIVTFSGDLTESKSESESEFGDLKFITLIGWGVFFFFFFLFFPSYSFMDGGKTTKP